MSYAENLWLFSVLLFGIIIVPGMDMLFVLANALTGGRRAGLAATGGIMLGGVVHTVFGATLVALILRLAPSLFLVMLLAGAAYMAWIGLSLMRSAIVVEAVGPAAPRPLAVVFRQGLVTCLLNPKAYLFVFSVFPQFIKPQYGQLWRQTMVIAVLCVATQFAVYGGLALAAAKSREFLTGSPGATVRVGRIAGLLIVMVAIWTAWHGVGTLRAGS